MDLQQCIQATQPPVTNVAAGNLNQVIEVHVKEEPEDDVDVGPTVLQHMDSCFRTSQSEIKQEDDVHNEENKRGLCKVEKDQVLYEYTEVTVEFTEDSQKVVTEPDHSQFKCDQCFKILKSKEVLVMHHKQVHATDLLKCGVCNEEFKDQIYLTSHIRKVHSDQEYECDICKTMCKSKQMLLEHILSLHHDLLAANTRLQNKTNARIKKCLWDMEEDQKLHDLRLQREQALIEREKKLMKVEEKYQDLQIEKIKLQIAMLRKKLSD